MGFNIRGGDKSSFALLSSKRGKAYAKSRADEAFALPAFSDAMPASTVQPQRPPLNASANVLARNQLPSEHETENVKRTMLQHESVFKEQLHELHRLYQKQCLLMSESNSDAHPDQVPEPPSSNGSFLCNSGTARLQEEKSLENASVSNVCDSNQSHQTLFSQIDDGKRPEDCMLSQVEIGHRKSIPYLESNHKQGRHYVFDSEQYTKSRPMIDLEQPPDEHFEVEILDEKPHIPSLSIKSEQPFDSSKIASSEGNKARGKTGTPTEMSRGPQCRKLFGFHIVDSVASEYLAGVKEEWKDDFREPKASSIEVSTDKKLFGFNIVSSTHEGEREELSKDYLVAKESETQQVLSFSKSVMTSSCAGEEPFVYSTGAFSIFERSHSLPDLNGGAKLIEGQMPPRHGLLQNNSKVSQHVNLDANSRPVSSASKLPHWLCQAPSASLLPMNGSTQRAVSHPKSLVSFPQVHDKTMRPSFLLPQFHDNTDELHKLPVATTKALAMCIEDRSCAWPQNGILSFDQREGFLRESSNTSTSQLFQDTNMGVLQQSYSGIHSREYLSSSIPYCYPPVRDIDKMGTLPLSSASLTSHIMGRQNYAFETQGPSTEFLSKVSSGGHINSGTILPWNQQTESFSSLLQKASTPEPFCNSSSPATSFIPWGVTSNYQGTSFLGIDYQDRAGLHTGARNNERSSSQSKSTTVPHIIDYSYAGPGVMGSVESTTNSQSKLYRRLETPASTQKERELFVDDHSYDLNAKKRLFDLNVSSQDDMPKGHMHDCNITDISYSGTQFQIAKAGSGISRRSHWGNSDAFEAPFIYQPQKEYGLKNACFEDVIAIKGEPAASLSDTNFMRLHNDISHFKKPAENQYLGAHMLRDNTRADYCSGEDETGGCFAEAKSSDGSGLTSCESLDGLHLKHAKARDDSNISCSEACHSLESRVPNYNEDAAFSSSLQQQKVFTSYGISKSFSLQDMQATFPHVDIRENNSPHGKEFADESDAANVVVNKDLGEASEVADILCKLGSDVPPTCGNEVFIDDCRKHLHLLADIIPQEDHNQDTDFEGTHAIKQPSEINTHKMLDAFELADIIPQEDYNQDIYFEGTLAIKQQSEINTHKMLDAFELAVLALTPVDPNSECIFTKPPDRGHGGEIVPMLRRRPSRRGRIGKDFQKEMFRSMSALSRHEATEDLQIIEGLIKSAAETKGCSAASEKPSSSPELVLYRSFGKTKSTLTCKGRKLNGTLNLCSWGETSRRKRMGRQRSQWLSLPPRVRMSLFSNNDTQ